MFRMEEGRCKAQKYIPVPITAMKVNFIVAAASVTAAGSSSKKKRSNTGELRRMQKTDVL